MTDTEAERQVKDFLARYEMSPDVSALRAGKVFGVMLGSAEVFFIYDAATETLHAHALIFRFPATSPTATPPPALLLEIERENLASSAKNTGKLNYQPENKGLYLSQAFTEAIAPETFYDQMQKLTVASLIWARESFAQLIARATAAAATIKSNPPAK